jgi:hypothetical protein
MLELVRCERRDLPVGGEGGELLHREGRRERVESEGVRLVDRDGRRPSDILLLARKVFGVGLHGLGPGVELLALDGLRGRIALHPAAVRRDGRVGQGHDVTTGSEGGLVLTADSGGGGTGAERGAGDEGGGDQADDGEA